jgi:UDP-N-acetylmuramoyl-tripeptide--D-alanyl-D-alanine ligase
MADMNAPLANHARFSLGEIAATTSGELVQLPAGVDLQSEVVGVSTDTRTLGENSLFIALHGARFNGHTFLQQAATCGAHAAIVEKSAIDKIGELPENLAIIAVKSTLRALGALAKFHRARFAIPVVAVTGSYGKTTTRAMIVAALGAQYRVLTSQENFNNEIGVPLTLLQLDETHEAAVVELAMRGIGQIAYLAEIAAPTVGVITNIGPQHIELLGSIENIAAAKAEVLAFLPASGAAVLPADDEYLDFFTDQAHAARIVTFGSNPSAEYCVSNVHLSESGSLQFTIHNSQSTIRNASLPLPGVHNATNAVAALAVAGVLGVPLADAAHALETVEIPGARMRILKNAARGLVIIDDCYNAGPTSMRAALETLRDFPSAQRRVAVLGAMRELGEHSEAEHRRAGALAANCAELVLGVGDETEVLLDEAREVGTIPFFAESFADAEEAAGRVLELVRAGDVVLVKGSRSVGLEVVVDVLMGELS